MSRSSEPQRGRHLKKFPLGMTCLVTGASSGLGRALSRELAQRGCRLLITGRQSPELEQTRRECLEVGSPRVELFCADLTVPSERQTLWEWAGHHQVEALVNNAGAGVAGLWAEQSSETDAQQLALLLEAPLDLAKRWLWHCRPTGRGYLLNIVSAGAYQPGPYTAVYYAAKAFLSSWSQALSEELKGTGLVVTAAYPGALKTAFASRAGRKPSPWSRQPSFAAKRIISAWERGQVRIVPGVQETWAVFLSRLFPEAWSAHVVSRLQASLQLTQKPKTH